MKRVILACIVIITSLLGLSSCGNPQSIRYESSFLELFNTVTKIVGYAENKEEFTSYSQFIYDELKEYHELYDIYNDYPGINNIKTINDNAGIKPVKVDQKIIDLINFSKNEYELTDGKVNIAFGAVLQIWHQYRTEGTDDPENAKLPPMELLKEKANHIDISKIIINEEDSTVFLEDPEMRLDVGAIAKGYATEMVSRAVKKRGFTSGMLSVGGNIRTIGKKADSGEPWNVGIQNPNKDSENQNVYILSFVNDFSLVTSGVYERYYTVEGEHYHHIIDSDTLFPSDYFASVSIICSDSGMADSLSTSIFNMSYEQGIKIIESLPDTEALWIFKNGDTKYSSNFKDYIKK